MTKRIARRKRVEIRMAELACIVRLERAVIDAAVLRLQVANQHVEYEVTDADLTQTEQLEDEAIERLLAYRAAEELLATGKTRFLGRAIRMTKEK